MSDPERLFDTEGDAFELGLLRSAMADKGSESAFGRTLAAMGAAAGLSATAMAATALTATHGGALGTAAAPVSAGGSVLGMLKAISVGALAGVLTLAAVELAAPGAIVPSRARETAALARPDAPPDAPVVRPAATPAAPTAVSDVAPAAQPESGERPAPVAPHGAAKPPSSAGEKAHDDRSAAPLAAEPAAPPPSASSAAPHATSLQAEMAAIERVRAALGAGDPRGAIALLDRMQADFPRPALGQEAVVLRIEALVASGDRARAQALADAFFAAESSSPHALRVRALLSARGPEKKP